MVVSQGFFRTSLETSLSNSVDTTTISLCCFDFKLHFLPTTECCKFSFDPLTHVAGRFSSVNLDMVGVGILFV